MPSRAALSKGLPCAIGHRQHGLRHEPTGVNPPGLRPARTPLASICLDGQWRLRDADHPPGRRECQGNHEAGAGGCAHAWRRAAKRSRAAPVPLSRCPPPPQRHGCPRAMAANSMRIRCLRATLSHLIAYIPAPFGAFLIRLRRPVPPAPLTPPSARTGTRGGTPCMSHAEPGGSPPTPTKRMTHEGAQLRGL